MKTRIFRCASLFLLILLSACQFNSTYSNREEDKAEAEAVVEDFYAALRTKDYEKTVPFLSESFLEVSNKADLFQFYAKNDEVLGEIENYTLRDWKSNVVMGTNPRSEYLLVYDVKRPNYDSEEIFTLTKIDDKVQILGYRVNSPDYESTRSRSAKPLQ
ncbi:hypothetical protein HUK80_06660 [Flavobacterium sp. MAH-1]|uniref:DUF4019 domain-containing protein n=1 Tax=Flavobacterium agri TaxID=2743471 RepID=A0A7Y9C6P0_9FLAO|nr:hypothetical protein [Flavobacterium agri]NUY80569.1 hypothetical protein [Flavobacterium agri]NYA70593.1 hypothetical protein [Flavobacterium agri]